MVNNSTNINKANIFVNIDGIVHRHLFRVIVRFVNIGGIVDHHLFRVIVRFVNWSTIPPILTKRTSP
jgi:hypothetical protein